DMAQKRCRGSGILPTWCKNDVGAAAFSRHGIKTMSGGEKNTQKNHQKSSDFRWLLLNLLSVLLSRLLSASEHFSLSLCSIPIHRSAVLRSQYQGNQG